MEDQSIRIRTDQDGNVYKMRDVWAYKPHFVTCQYAVKQADGRDAWFDCPEGVLFSAIEPYQGTEKAD